MQQFQEKNGLAVGPDRPRERRVPVQSVVLPFMGSRGQDFSPFQYLVQDVSDNGIKIALPRWVIKREALVVGDAVNFHLPFRRADLTYNGGTVAWARWEDELDSQVCGIRVEAPRPMDYPVFVSFDQASIDIDLIHFDAEADILVQVLRDSILLKRGILIYLKHLIPVIPRLSDFPRESMAELCSYMCDDVRERIAANVAALEDLLGRAEARTCSLDELYACIDPEKIRATMEPEIYVDVWKETLDSPTVNTYLDAIKQLEQKLYYSYNTIIMLYIRSVSQE